MGRLWAFVAAGAVGDGGGCGAVGALVAVAPVGCQRRAMKIPQDTFYYIIGIAAAVTWFRRGSRDGFAGKGHARKASE